MNPRSTGGRGRRHPIQTVCAFALALTYAFSVVWTNLQIDTESESVEKRISRLSRGSSRISSSRECYLASETKKQGWIDEWLEQNVPLVDAVLTKQAQNSNGTIYQVSLVVKHLIQEKDYWNEQITWFCNRQDNVGRLIVFNTPVHLVECTFKDPTETLHTIWPSKVSTKSNVTIRYSNMEHFWRCYDQQVKEDSYHLQKRGVNKPLLAGCTIVRGVDDHIAPWIEYHRILGYDYFWVFVNEPFPDQRGWIQRPYVKYIPYNFYWDDHKTHSMAYRKPKSDIFWQEAMQMQCLYHAKRFPNIEWLTTTDVDEYIWVNDTRYMEKESPLKTFLWDHQEEKNSLAGQIMNSVFFGRHPKMEPAAHREAKNASRWLMDYTYRSAKPKWQRYKVIYQPHNSMIAEVHTVKGGESHRLHNVYFQHYKKAEQGVAKAKSPDDLIQDTRLRDRYRKQVWKALQRSINGTLV